MAFKGIKNVIPSSVPTDYDRQADFGNFGTNSPGSVPYIKLDAEFNAVEKALDETQDRLSIIQRDDGNMRSKIVGPEALADEITFLPGTLAQWATNTDYAVNDGVVYEKKLYRAVVAHTSGTFETDLADGKWVVISEPEHFLTNYAALRDIVPSTRSVGFVFNVTGRAGPDDGGGGSFWWNDNDLSTEVANDEVTAGEGDGGIYVAPTSDKTGASGAWVRQDNRIVTPEMYGGDIQAAIDALTDGMVLELQAAEYVVSSNIAIVKNNITIRGAGAYTTTIVCDTDLAGDVITVGDGSTAIQNLTVENLRVLSSVAQSSGAGIRLNKVARSHLLNVIMGGQDGNKNLYNGFHFDGTDFMVLRGYEAEAQNEGLIVNGLGGSYRSDLFVSEGKIAQCAIGVNCAGDFGGLAIDTSSIIQNDTNMRVSRDQVNGINREIFLQSACLLDASNVGPGLELDEPEWRHIFVDGAWINSNTTHGVHVKQAAVSQSRLRVNGGNIGNNKGDGVRIEDADLREFLLSGADVRENDGWGVNATVPINDDADGRGAIIAPQSNRFFGNGFGDVTWDTIPPVAGQSFTIIIGDDGVFSFQPSAFGTSDQSAGLVFVGRGQTGFRLFAFFQMSGIANLAPIDVNGLKTTTGTLSGTTQSDGDETVSVSTDGRIYIENRSGGSVAYPITLVATWPGHTQSN